jgi:hypothetical protein
MDFTSSLRDERDLYPASNPPDKSSLGVLCAFAVYLILFFFAVPR